MKNGIVICTEKDLAVCRAYLAMAVRDIRGFRARAARMAAARLDYWANVYRGLRWYPGGTIPFYADDLVPLVSTFRDLEQMILRRRVLIQYFENIGGYDEYLTAASGEVVYLSNTDLVMDDGPGAPRRLYPVCKLLAIILPDED